MNLHFSIMGKYMKELNIQVSVDKFPETIYLDIAGFSSEDDLKEAVEQEVEEFLEALDEVDRSNIALDETESLDWFVVLFTTCEGDWVFCDTYEPEGWEWSWIEYFGNSQTLSSGVCQAACELSVEPSSVEEVYCGEFGSDEAFAEDMAETTGCINNEAAWPYQYVDWELAAKELMMDYMEDSKHYFRSM